MKKTNRRNVLLGGVLFFAAACAVLLTVFLIPKDNGSFSLECLQARIAVTRFLNAVEKEDYETAFSYVDCVSEGSGAALEPGECKDVWIDRVRRLKNDARQTYLTDHSELSVSKVDGVLTVTVRLSVRRQGYEDKFYTAGNRLQLTDRDGWKIRSLSAEAITVQTELEKALSGWFAAENAAAGS